MDVASLTAQRKRLLSSAHYPASVIDLLKASRMPLSHCLLGLRLSLSPSIFPSKMIFPKPSLLFRWPKHFSFCFFTKFSNHWSSSLSSSLIDLFVRCSVHCTGRISAWRLDSIERSIQKSRGPIFYQYSPKQAWLVWNFITRLLSVGGSCGSFGTMPHPKLRPAIEHSDWLIGPVLVMK